MARSTFFPSLFVVALLAGCSSTYETASWGQENNGNSQTPVGWTNYDPSATEGADSSQDQSRDRDSAEQNQATGICYVKAPAIPASSQTMQVLKRPERRVADGSLVIPAQYVTVEIPPEEFDGFVWMPAVCEDGIDRQLVMRTQEALIEHGYDIGAVDGVVGPATSAGLEYFKRDNGLYGEGMTHQVLEALGIDPSTGGSAFAGI
jgi:putative peptidoglycan binding protein